MKPNTPQPTPTEEAIGAISKDFDFKMYLEAVVGASKRTRATLYLLVLTVIVICATYRNLVWPDWISGRLSMLQKAHAAATTPGVEDGHEAVEYANRYLFQSPLPKDTKPSRPALTPYSTPGGSSKTALGSCTCKPVAGKAPPPDEGRSDGKGDPRTESAKSEALRELEVQIDAMIRKRTELTTVQIPILGIQIDMNDLGIMGGVLLITILYVLRASIRREWINLKVATRRTAAYNPDNLELLLMAQVLAHASIEKKRSDEEKFISNAAIYFIICLPVIVQIWICIDDTRSWDNGSQLIGGFWNSMELWLEWLTTLTIAVLSALCAIEQGQVNGAFDRLERIVEKEAKTRGEKAKERGKATVAPSAEGSDQAGTSGGGEW